MTASDRKLSASKLEAECRRLARTLRASERRQRLPGYEIPDGIVQKMTAAAMHLETVGQQAKFASREVRESYANGLQLLRESIDDARAMIGSLVREKAVKQDERGLCSALSRAAEKLRHECGLRVDFHCQLDDARLPMKAERLLLRIAEEALNNVARHAQAKHAELRVTKSGSTLDMTIADDGIGFDPRLVPAGHFGLEGIRARCRVLRADLTIDSKLAKGTRVAVRWKIPRIDASKPKRGKIKT